MAIRFQSTVARRILGSGKQNLSLSRTVHQQHWWRYRAAGIGRQVLVDKTYHWTGLFTNNIDGEAVPQVLVKRITDARWTSQYPNWIFRFKWIQTPIWKSSCCSYRERLQVGKHLLCTALLVSFEGRCHIRQCEQWWWEELSKADTRIAPFVCSEHKANWPP